MRPEEHRGAVGPRFAGHLADIHPRLAQRVLRLDFLRCVVVDQHVVGDPVVQVGLHVVAGHEAADLVAHDHLQVVGEARCRQHVRQHRRQARVGVGLVGVVEPGLVGGLAAEEHRDVAVLLVAQGNEAEIVEFLLAAVGDRHLGRALQRQVAGAGAERVRRQALDRAAAFRAADRRAPAVLGEGLGDALRQDPGGVAPEVLGVVGAVDVLDIVHAFHRSRLRAVGQAQEEVRQHQGHVARILALAEGAPLDQLQALEDLGQVARHGQFGEAVHVEQAWAGGGDERRVGSRGDVRQLLQQADVLRMATEGEVADQQAEGVSAEGAVFLFVDLLEQCALVELDRLLQVVLQFVLADVQQAQLEPRAGLGVAHQLVQATPGGFQLLQLGVVDDLVELVADQRIDLADAVVDHRHGVLVDGHALVEDLGGEFREHVAGVVLLAVVVGHAALGDDLVEQGQGLGRTLAGLFGGG